jgi:hypothetical protein
MAAQTAQDDFGPFTNDVVSARFLNRGAALLAPSRWSSS